MARHVPPRFHILPRVHTLPTPESSMSNDSTANGDTSYESCLRLIQYGVTPQPDNDVSGIGVIIAFMASAYLTLVLVVGAYIFGYVDQSLMRPVDTLVHKRKGSNSSHGGNMVVMFRQTVLSFSDQQIVTGIAVLIAGFAKFTSAMSVYHFQMVIYLAWMSSSTHLSALTMLSGFLRERQLLLTWRLVGMLALFVGLLIALIPTWPNLWAIDFVPDVSESTGWGIPAQCFWLRTYGQGVNPDAPIGCVILLGSYVWKVCSIFHSSRTFFHRWVRGPTEYFLERWVRHEARRVKQGRTRTKLWCGYREPTAIHSIRIKLRTRYRISMAMYAMTMSQFEFSSSFAASLWLSVGGLAWGTVQIVVPRLQNDWWNYEENGWTFGQITPLVLLIQPLGSVLEHIHKQNRGVHADDSSELTTVELESNTQTEHGRWRRRFTRAFRSNFNRSVQPASRRGTLSGKKTLLEVFSNLEIRSPEDRVIGDLPGHQRMMYESRYFKGLIWTIQACALLAISLICGYDAQIIGIDVNDSWLWICSSVLLGLLVNILWTLACIPFSRMFR